MENEPPRTLFARIGDALTPTIGDLTGTLTVGAVWWANGFTDPDTLQDAYAHLSTMTPVDPKLAVSAYFAGLGALMRCSTNWVVHDYDPYSSR